MSRQVKPAVNEHTRSIYFFNKLLYTSEISLTNSAYCKCTYVLSIFVN